MAALAWVCSVGGCYPRVSQAPLSTEPGGEGYYYGAPAYGGKVLDSPIADAPKVRTKPNNPSEAIAKSEASTKKEADHDSVEASTPAGEPDLTTEQSALRFVGDYSGKDTVVIELDGFPPEPQEDENAKLRVEVDGPLVKVTVVDSNSGEDLCTLSGEPKSETVHFTPGQDCFSEMLGVPMSAELEDGQAVLKGEQITVRFAVKLALSAEGESVSGKLNYLFEGERE